MTKSRWSPTTSAVRAPGHGDTSRCWEDIAAFHDGLARANSVFADLAGLAQSIVQSPFPRAGLRGMTSMHDLIVGLTGQILDNPHLVVLYEFDRRRFRFEFRDGSVNPWVRTAEPDESYAVLERFLTKRARWFRAPPPR